MGALVLRVVSGAAVGTDLPVDPEFVVGCGEPDMGNVQGDREISRRHARFSSLEEGSILVEDLQSANGTYVNGHRIEKPRVLRRGDRVEVGGTVLELVSTGPADDRTRRR